MSVVIFLIAEQNIAQSFLAAPKLVSHRHHHKGRVVSVFLQYPEALVYKILLLSRYLLVHSSPERKLRLHIDTEDIGGFKRGIRRTAGMKSVMVYTVLLSCFHYVEPTLYICRRKACKREYHTVVLSAQKCLSAVHIKLSAADAYFPYAERNSIHFPVHGYMKLVNIRGELVPFCKRLFGYVGNDILTLGNIYRKGLAVVNSDKGFSLAA